MIPLEVLFAQLDALRAETIELIETPSDRTEFGFGTLHGRIASIKELRERIEALVNQANNGDDDQ